VANRADRNKKALMNCLGPLRNRAGVTLLEVLVALLLLALLAGSLIKIAAVSGHWVKEAERQAQAAVLAFGILDYCRAQPGLLASGPSSGTDARQLLLGEPPAENTYPWQADFQPYNGQAQLWQVQVRVNWDGGQSQKAVEMYTLVYVPP
jgi:prepilin-type N-terminal cleavage/methylation domain-containing protein